MRTKEEIKQELEQLQEHLNKYRIRCNDVEKELAECLAEFKVGERVICGDSEYEIAAFRLAPWGNDALIYTGRKVRKSGVLSKKTSGLYSTAIRAKRGEEKP